MRWAVLCFDHINRAQSFRLEPVAARDALRARTTDILLASIGREQSILRHLIAWLCRRKAMRSTRQPDESVQHHFREAIQTTRACEAFQVTQ